MSLSLRTVLAPNAPPRFEILVGDMQVLVSRERRDRLSRLVPAGAPSCRRNYQTSYRMISQNHRMNCFLSRAFRDYRSNAAVSPTAISRLPGAR